MSENKPVSDSFKEEVMPILKWYPLLYFILLILIAGIGFFYIANIDISFTNKFIQTEYIAPKQAEEIPKQTGSVMPGIDVMKVGFSDDASLAKGKELFKNTCAACHGDLGNGDGPGGAALNPKPRNFHAKEGWKNGRKLSDIFKTLEEGIPNSGMISYNFMPLEDRFALLHYVRSLEKDFPETTKDELTQLDQMYSLKQGRKTPNTIPVDLAIKKLIAENPNAKK